MQLCRRAILALVLAVGFTMPAGADEAAARATVERLHDTLLDVMQRAESLDFEARRTVLHPVVVSAFDLPFVSSLVTGDHWDGWDEPRRSLMLQRFTDLTVATYASRFDGYSGQQFKVVETRPIRSDRVLVRSILESPGEAPVQLDYVLQPGDDGLRIVNVVAEGVSDLSIKRADYTAVLEAEGFDELMRRLEEQIERLGDAG